MNALMLKYTQIQGGLVMKFTDLTKDQQNFIIDMLDQAIENRAYELGIQDYEDPTFEEYIEFFNDFDEKYFINEDGFPEPVENNNQYLISFENGKVVLEVY